MASERSSKRQRTSSLAELSVAAQTPLPPTPGNQDNDSKQAQQLSWYASWSRKAPAVIKLAHENIPSIGGATKPAEPPSKILKPRSLPSPSLAMLLGKKQSSRALPVDATTTAVHAEASNSPRKASTKLEDTPSRTPAPENKESTGVPATASKRDVETEDKITVKRKPEAQPIAEPIAQPETSQEVIQTRTSWLGWLGKGDGQGGPRESVTQGPSNTIPNNVSVLNDSPKQSVGIENTSAQLSDDVSKQQNVTRKSWLPWSSDPSETTDLLVKDGPQKVDATVDDIAKSPMSKDTPNKQPPGPSGGSRTEMSPLPSLPYDGARPSAWAFWSRERRNNNSNVSLEPPHEGEIAISDTPSQAKPRKTSISVNREETTLGDEIRTEQKAGSQTDTQTKADRDSTTIKAESSTAAVTVQEPTENKKSASKSARTYQNLLLPGLQSTLKLPEQTSIVQKLARLLYITKEPELKHLSLVKEAPRIKNALVIGVHGYFPAPLIRSVLGQPTGTSIKFADMAAKAIKRWTKARGYECQVKTAALEGEGRITDRVELLWKLLLNWIEEIRNSDFILVACHSQGVPVAIMLVAKLIQFGCVNSARIGICAMAGVNMGPFLEYKSRWISGSAGELFEFSDPGSKVSADYVAALDTVLRFGARLTYIGSIDDQLVSLESSVFSPISHPHIYRAVSIDARVHAPNFLSHLVGFALKLRNLGVQDHGLIRELSSPLAGSLYTGDGHSRIYESDNCYDLAVEWSLLSTSMLDVPLSQRQNVPGSGNPYILPFAMRGMLEEEFVKNELHGEASELLQQFDDWKPTTKVLKDVKFRLEGVRSKL